MLPEEGGEGESGSVNLTRLASGSTDNNGESNPLSAGVIFSIFRLPVTGGGGETGSATVVGGGIVAAFRRACRASSMGDSFKFWALTAFDIGGVLDDVLIKREPLTHRWKHNIPAG